MMIDGHKVKIGDTVSFKSDIEQWGTVKKILPNRTLVLEKEDGFSGDYIGGQTVTQVDADRCWIE